MIKSISDVDHYKTIIFVTSVFLEYVIFSDHEIMGFVYCSKLGIKIKIL